MRSREEMFYDRVAPLCVHDCPTREQELKVVAQELKNNVPTIPVASAEVDTATEGQHVSVQRGYVEDKDRSLRLANHVRRHQ